MDGDSLSMIIVFEQCLGINNTLRDKNVIKFNKERYTVYRGQESYVCNSVTMKYHKVYCEEIKPSVLMQCIFWMDHYTQVF